MFWGPNNPKHTLTHLLTSPNGMLDLEHIGRAVDISLISCLEAEIQVFKA